MMFKPTIVYFAAVLAVFLSADHQIHAFSAPLTTTTSSPARSSATTRSNVIFIEQPHTTTGTALFAGKGGEEKKMKKKGKQKIPSQKLFYALLFSFVTVDFFFFHTIFNK